MGEGWPESFNLFPRLSSIARAVGGFILNHHSVPPPAEKRPGVDEMLLGGELDDERMRAYWGNFVKPVIEKPEAGQLQFGWSDMGEYIERE